MTIFSPQINTSQSLDEFSGFSLLCETLNVISPDTKHQKIQPVVKVGFGPSLLKPDPLISYYL